MEKLTRVKYISLIKDNHIVQRRTYSGVHNYCERAIELLIQNDVSPYFIYHNLYNTYSIYDIKSTAYMVRALHSNQMLHQGFQTGDIYYKYNFLDRAYLIELKLSGVLIVSAYKE